MEMAWQRWKNNSPNVRIFPAGEAVCGDMSMMRAAVLERAEQAGAVNAEIAARLKRRDASMVAELIELYQHRLLRYLVYLTGNRDLAEDLFQETWLRVLERGSQYDGRARFDTWLFAIARNLMLDQARKRVLKSLDEPVSEDSERPMEVASSDPSPFEDFLLRENAARVAEALLQLSATSREVLVLRFHEELALEEIATVTRAPLSTVKSRLYRGMNALADWLRAEQALPEQEAQR
jgi:RNA polymerase sigma-70 factor (ECF subfamily)